MDMRIAVSSCKALCGQLKATYMICGLKKDSTISIQDETVWKDPAVPNIRKYSNETLRSERTYSVHDYDFASQFPTSHGSPPEEQHAGSSKLTDLWFYRLSLFQTVTAWTKMQSSHPARCWNALTCAPRPRLYSEVRAPSWRPVSVLDEYDLELLATGLF